MQARTLTVLIFLAAIVAGCARTPEPRPQQTGYDDAVELQNQFRALAEQLLPPEPGNDLQGYVAMPTAFVNQNNPQVTSPLGRQIAESMYHEFNLRGYATREYHLSGDALLADSRNDLALVKKIRGQKWNSLLVGTYLPEKDAIFINARLVRASDGLVLRTGELVLRNSPLIQDMLRTSAAGTFISSQSAPVLAPSYPTLSGSVLQSGTASIPIIQGR